MQKIKIKQKPKPTRNRFERALLNAHFPSGGFIRPVSWLGRQLWPEFEELPVGLMAFTLIVMVLLESDLQILILDALYSGAGGIFGIFLINILMAIAHALYHVFLHRRKSDEEKRIDSAIRHLERRSGYGHSTVVTCKSH